MKIRIGKFYVTANGSLVTPVNHGLTGSCEVILIRPSKNCRLITGTTYHVGDNGMVMTHQYKNMQMAVIAEYIGPAEIDSAAVDSLIAAEEDAKSAQAIVDRDDTRDIWGIIDQGIAFLNQAKKQIEEFNKQRIS